MTDELKKRWLPPGAKHGIDIPPNSTIIELGESGDGKTHGARQLCFDPWLQDEGILLLVSDGNALGTIGPDALAQPGVAVMEVGTFDEVRSVAQQLGAARRSGEAIPETIVYDGLFASSHKTRKAFEDAPIMVPQKDRDGKYTGEMVQDKRGEFARKGYGGVDAVIELRDLAKPRTLIVTATTWTSNNVPIAELSLEGQIIPKNLTALSTVTLNLARKRLEFNPKTDKAIVEASEYGRPWLKFDRDPQGNLTGVAVQRFCVTEGGGEVKTKPHRVLNFNELMDLPNIVRRLHGKERLEWWMVEGRPART